MSRSGPPENAPAAAAGWPADPLERAAAAAAAGLRRPATAETAAAIALLVDADPDPRVRVAALGALARAPHPPSDRWLRAAADPDPAVRRRAADLAPAFAGAGNPSDPGGTSPSDPGDNREDGGEIAGPPVAAGLLLLLDDPDGSVAEAAAWALGELGIEAAGPDAVRRLADSARSHGDPLVREAAVAALGALGDPAGLDAVLAACGDKPAIRRRAVLALAAFEGPEIDAALQTALEDKDWQTRQAAEDLLD